MNKNRSKDVSPVFNNIDYNISEFHYDDIIPESNSLKNRFKEYFVLSTYEEYDFFIFLLEEDLKIHKIEDFVFYNSTWRYHPYEKDKNGNELEFKERLYKSESRLDHHLSLPASFDGSIIGEDDASSCHPDYGGIQIELKKTEKRIKKILFFVDSSHYSTKIKKCIIRLSEGLIYWQEERNGIDSCFFYKEIGFSGNFPIELCFTLERSNEDNWDYSFEKENFNCIEELVGKYAKDYISVT